MFCVTLILLILLLIFLGVSKGLKLTSYLKSHGPSNAEKHLRGRAHGLIPSSEVKEEEEESSVASQLIHQRASFSAETFRSKLLRFIAVLHLPFSIVEHSEFRDLMLYAAPRLRGNDALPRSGTTIKLWMLELFVLQQAFLVAFMLDSGSQVHLSFDLWTSPNHYCMLGVVAHFIDQFWINRTVLLALIPLRGAHSGEVMGDLLIRVIIAYSLKSLIGYCVTDNAPDNDTSLVTLEAWFATQGIIWTAKDHRLRCFGHIINLISNAFTANKPLKIRPQGRQARVPRVPGAPRVPKPTITRPVDCITKLHKIIKFITAPGQRADEFMKCNREVYAEMLRPIKDNDTRWFSIYLSCKRALQLKDSIDLFVSRNITPRYVGAKDLKEWVMTSEDWQYCSDVVAFMEPIYILLLSLEGKNEEG